MWCRCWFLWYFQPTLLHMAWVHLGSLDSNMAVIELFNSSKILLNANLVEDVLIKTRIKYTSFTDDPHAIYSPFRYLWSFKIAVQFSLKTIHDVRWDEGNNFWHQIDMSRKKRSSNNYVAHVIMWNFRSISIVIIILHWQCC